MKRNVYTEIIPTVGKLLIRYPELGDTRAMAKYINELSKEKTFVTMQGERMTVKQERDFLVGKLKSIRQRKAVLLLAFIDTELVGISGVDSKAKVESHAGVFGISIRAKHRGKGVGKKLMAAVLEEANEKIRGLRLISLGVFGTNQKAQKMYTQLGFKEYGRLPGGVKHLGEYIDYVYMYKEVK